MGETIPGVHYVPILEEGGAPTPLDLEDALPLSSLLAPVAEQKDAIAAALDTLQAEPYEPSPGKRSPTFSLTHALEKSDRKSHCLQWSPCF